MIFYISRILNINLLEEKMTTYEQNQMKFDKMRISLKKHIRDTNQDIFVCNYMVFSKDDRMFSICTLTSDTHSYFPETDYINFIDLEKNEMIHLIPFSSFVTSHHVTKVPDDIAALLAQKLATYYECRNCPSVHDIKKLLHIEDKHHINLDRV